MSIVVFAPRFVVGGGLYFDLSLLERAAEVILLIILSGVGSVVTMGNYLFSNCGARYVHIDTSFRMTG